MQAYFEEYGVAGIYLLPVNRYGSKDNFDPETSAVISWLTRKKALTEFGKYFFRLDSKETTNLYCASGICRWIK